MDELMRFLKEESGRLERKFEKLVEDLRQQQQEILNALERVERDRATLSKILDRLEKQVEENREELHSLREMLRHQ